MQRRKRDNPKFPQIRRIGPPTGPAAAKSKARAGGGNPGGMTTWGHVADWYDSLVGDAGSEYHSQVVLPGVLRLLGASAGMRILDVACGQGVLCRLLHAKGVRITGVDAAAELLALARERGPESIRYLLGDARDLSMVEPGGFDAAACVLAIQNIDPLPPVFSGVARSLRRGGHFVLAMMHPCFRPPKASGWGWDANDNVQFRRVDRYLLPRKEPIVTHPGKDPGTYTWTFHRPLQTYIAALVKAGMQVDALEEWTSHKSSDSGPRAAAENVARREIPLFLAIRAIKVAVAAPVSPGPVEKPGPAETGDDEAVDLANDAWDGPDEG